MFSQIFLGNNNLKYSICVVYTQYFVHIFHVIIKLVI